MNYTSMSKQELLNEKQVLCELYNNILSEKLSLDMSRGKPEKRQLDISEKILTVLSENKDCFSENGTDCRNYGILDGIDEAKKLFADILDVSSENVFVGGNSSLNMMFDTLMRFMVFGVSKEAKPWSENKKNIFLCPVPGYDRHFAVCETLGIEMVNVPMTKEGPDMDIVEELVKNPDVRGIWCVPKYSNPEGVTYSDETVKRMAALKPASSDFRIMWDNAYCVHHLYDEETPLLNIIDECEKAGNPDMVYVYTSTSKISFPGAGVAVMASSKANIDYTKSIMNFQTIGYDKLNMLRHVKYFGDAKGVKEYMKKHADILRPKFEMVVETLEKELSDKGIASWIKPQGGYFVSLNVLEGTAKRTVSLCKDAGVVLTGAGATFPYGKDPEDRNIRIAPSFPTVEDLKSAMRVLCVCTRLSAVEKLLESAK
ncbi:MAG: aminotransferase class I/II-fold pyridoxal phosphate-dependent enzyme [Ruminococcaceae bacterium]|nr:aminotransferase class I/II-fold pyridoxal phosphate-dependent enzyme [Oscillospiraceae bacterium]